MSEKKRPSRAQFSSRVRFKVAGQKEIGERFASNLSHGGMFIREDKPPAVGSLILIEFVLPNGQPLSRAAARVVHAKPAQKPGEKTAGMGLEFVKFDKISAAIVEEFNVRHAADAPLPPPREETASQFKRMTLKNLDRKPMFGLSGPVIGVDLGTINSCVAAVKDDSARVITSSQGYEIVPSVVFLDESGNIIVGHTALEKMILAPARAVYGSKRFLGRPFASKEVRALGHFFNYELVAGDDGRCAAKLGTEVVSLEEVSAHILSALKEMAEQSLGEAVKRAVITVPAYFGATQRQAVRDAARLAGLWCERILNEPTAAAVAFGLGREMNKTVLVYDLGGGTFDVSVLRIEEDALEVLASDGDAFLGGTDFDDRITEYVLSTFERAQGVNVRQDSIAVQRVKFAAEMAKKQLSEATRTDIDLPHIAITPSGSVHLHLSLERGVVEALCQDLVDRTLSIVSKTLAQAGLKSSAIDEVILVGGQSRAPAVRTLLESTFGKKPSSAVHPDEAVAVGAALVANAFEAKKKVNLTDLLPGSIRMGLADGRTKLLLARGTKLPAQTEFEAETVQDGSDVEFAVNLFRGEHEGQADNAFLGSLKLPSNYSIALAGAKAKVTVRVSADGLLSISAAHPMSKEVKELEISLTQS